MDDRWKEIDKTIFNCLAPATLRELGLVTIFWDVNFTTVRRRFDEGGNLVDDSFLAIDKFLDELLWMAETLRYGRENVTIGGSS